MAWEMECEDAEGRQILFELSRGLDPNYPFYLELYVRDGGQWEIVDTMQADDIDEEGMYLNADGALSLNYGTPDEEMGEWITHFIVRVEPEVLREVVAWAHDCLRLHPQPRVRVSGLAERTAVA